MNGVLERTAVVVDPHPLWLDALEPVIARVGVNVVGKTTSPRVGLSLVGELRPDMLVTELKSADGDLDGIALLQQARELVPSLRLVVLSMYDDTHHIDAALTAGAAVYVIKTAHPDDIASAIRQGFEYSLFLANGTRPRAVPIAEPPATEDRLQLTPREREILQLTAEGLSNAELARRFWVTEQTVKFHLSNVYRKLDVSNRTEASRWAHVHGLVPARARGSDEADAA